MASWGEENGPENMTTAKAQGSREERGYGLRVTTKNPRQLHIAQANS